MRTSIKSGEPRLIPPPLLSSFSHPSFFFSHPSFHTFTGERKFFLSLTPWSDVQHPLPPSPPLHPPAAALPNYFVTWRWKLLPPNHTIHFHLHSFFSLSSSFIFPSFIFTHFSLFHNFCFRWLGCFLANVFLLILYFLSCPYYPSPSPEESFSVISVLVSTIMFQVSDFISSLMNGWTFQSLETDKCN